MTTLATRSPDSPSAAPSLDRPVSRSRHAERLRARYGPWAVVTGASDGIGRAFARELATAGVHVVLVARREAALTELARELEASHAVTTRVVAQDLARPDAHAELARATSDLDVGLLVASAGFGTSGAFASADLETELAMIDVNCRAVAALAHHFGGRFVRRGRGGLVLLSSLLAFQGVPRAANYAATKAYVQSLAEGLRLELAASGVDVLACAPGPTRSGFEHRADMRMTMGETPEVIARGALAALPRRGLPFGTVRPGLLSKLLELSLALLPRAFRVLALARVMDGMTRHRG